MPEEITTQAEVEQPVKGKTQFGNFADPTPMWATWVFRIQFFLNKALLLWIASTDIVPAESMKVWVGTLAAIDAFVWGIAKSIGVKPPEEEK